jgi:hypothetical protein
MASVKGPPLQPDPAISDIQTGVLRLCERRVGAARQRRGAVGTAEDAGGGFYTGYDAGYSHGSTEMNTETTSLATLALQGLESEQG